MPTQKKIRHFLQIFSIILVVIYIYTFSISIDRSSSDAAPVAGGEEGDAYNSFWTLSLSTSRDEISSSASTINYSFYAQRNCVLGLLQSYISTTVVWCAIIIVALSKKKNNEINLHRQSFVIFGSAIVLLAIVNYQFNRGSCKQLSISSHAIGLEGYVGTLNSTNNEDRQYILTTKAPNNNALFPTYKGSTIRISFQLHYPNNANAPKPDAFSKKNYRCDDRPDLPPSLGKNTVLNFTTSIETDLNIVFVGDSIGAQFAQAVSYQKVAMNMM